MSPFAVVGSLIGLFFFLLFVAAVLNLPRTQRKRPIGNERIRRPNHTTATRPIPLTRRERFEMIAGTQNMAAGNPEGTARRIRSWLSDDPA